MTNQQNTLDEWVDELLDKHITRESHKGAVNRIRHQLRQAILQKFQEVQHNCNAEKDQPNDVHLQYFNQGYKKGVADLESKLKEVERLARQGIADEIDKWLADIPTDNIDSSGTSQLTPTSQGDSK